MIDLMCMIYTILYMSTYSRDGPSWGPKPPLGPIFYFFKFVVLRKIERKVFLDDSLELETFHCLICLSLGNQYHVVPSR